MSGEGILSTETVHLESQDDEMTLNDNQNNRTRFGWYFISEVVYYIS